VPDEPVGAAGDLVVVMLGALFQGSSSSIHAHDSRGASRASQGAMGASAAAAATAAAPLPFMMAHPFATTIVSLKP
jgi:hypothetical protein